MAVVKVRKNVHFLERKSNSELLHDKDEAQYLKQLWANRPREVTRWQNKINHIDRILKERGVA